MAQETFAEQLRAGYLSVAGCFSLEERAVISRARDIRNASPVERNRLLAQIVCTYRSGQRERWGPVILDLLAPTLVVILQGLRPEPPVMDEEEIRQQLVDETLRAAARVPLLESGLETRFRLTSRIYTRMLRWLSREGRRRRGQVRFERCKELPR